MQLIYHPDRPELVDVEFKSHGLKDFLKTGFGYVLFSLIFESIFVIATHTYMNKSLQLTLFHIRIGAPVSAVLSPLSRFALFLLRFK